MADGKEMHAVDWNSDSESLSTVPLASNRSMSMSHDVKKVYRELQDISNRLKVIFSLSLEA
jgi:hypothetical protein